MHVTTYVERARWRVRARRAENAAIVAGLTGACFAILAIGPQRHTFAVLALVACAVSVACLAVREAYRLDAWR